MTLEEYAETQQIYKKLWKLLDPKFDCFNQEGFPEIAIALKEIADVDA